MVRPFLILCLVALIGNPGCCCAFASPVVAFADAGDADLDSLPPCCRAKRLAEKNSPGRTPGERRDPPCPCSKRVGFVPAEKLIPPSPSPAPAGPPALVFCSIVPPADSTLLPPSGNRLLLATSPGVPPPLYLLHRALLC
jgi:hypothetical protein